MKYKLQKERKVNLIPGHAEVIKILVNYTEDPNAPDREGRTPMEIATQNEDFEIMKILEPFASTPSFRRIF